MLQRATCGRDQLLLRKLVDRFRKDRKEKDLEDKVKIQNEAIKSLGDMIAQMNELRQIGLKTSSADVQSLANQIIKDITILQSTLAKSLVETAV